jgi:hypothetical protein
MSAEQTATIRVSQSALTANQNRLAGFRWRTDFELWE